MRQTEKSRILIIEDDAHIAEGLKLNLSLQGYEAAIADSGTEGLRMWKEYNPHMIVLDIMLPGIDGVEFVRRLKATGGLGPMRIVMLTARADDAAKYAALEAGVDDFLTKPFRMIEVRTRLTNLEAHNALTAQLHAKNRELRDRQQHPNADGHASAEDEGHFAICRSHCRE